MPEVSIIIVNFNTKILVLDCIDSIKKSTHYLEYEIIVVDNGSKDGSLESLRKLEGIILIENKENLGFSKANNQGIKQAKGKYILLLNSDCSVEDGAIEKLVKFAKNNIDVGVVGPKLINRDGSVQPSAFRFPTISKTIRQYWFGQSKLLDKYIPSTKEPVDVEVLVMAALLITPQAIKKVGLLNEKYFMYFEDFDYCRRIKKFGLKVMYFPQAEVVHYHGESGRNLADSQNQWKRLIPSSMIYHGYLRYYFLTSIIWIGQKWQKFTYDKKN